MEKYSTTIKVKDGEVGDLINGATIHNVYTIGILESDCMIDCLDEYGKVLGWFCYSRNKKSHIYCDYNEYNDSITLATNGEINKEVWEYRQ